MERKDKKRKNRKNKDKDTETTEKRVSEPISELGGDNDDDFELDYEEPQDHIQSYKQIPRLTVKVNKPNDVKLQGYLDKKQPKAILFGKWKPRFGILKRDKLKYYENEESIDHLGVIDFNKVEASVYLLPDDQTTFKITLNGSTKVFLFRASTTEDADLWVRKLDDCIANSRGKHLSLTISDKKFWKDIYIDINEFKSVADNGDLLLFKSRQIATKLQRTFTNSDYDHVGMLVLGETDESMNTIFLLEAVSSEGVRLVEFLPNLEAYFEVYEKIVYRPIQNLERSEEMLSDLDTFLDQVLGK